MRSLIKSAICVLVAVISISAAGADMPALMRLDIKDGKVIAEIPKSLMGRRLMMATRIEQTSDSGEGLAGQLSDNCISIVFSLSGKELLVDIPLPNSLEGNSATPTVWKRYKVTSFKKDSTAVVDLTDLFQTQYSQLHTFPVKAYNSMGGQVRRVHTLKKDRSRFLGTEVSDSIASVLSDSYYKMDGYVMGVMKIAGDYSVRAQVRKMIFLPSTKDDFPQMEADPEVATFTLQRRSIDDPAKPVTVKDIVRRWNITPSDSMAWLAGNKVSPLKPIVFYVDTLLPKNWRPYVEEGLLAWNQAFEQAGFTDVIQVRDFPSEQSFFSASPYISRVIFAPSGMEEIEVGDLYDASTGEIFSAQICVHSNFIKKQHQELLKSYAAVNPDVRYENLPDSLAGQLVRLSVMNSVGKALGLRDLSKKNTLTVETVDIDQTLPTIYQQKAIAWLYGPASNRNSEAAKVLADLRMTSNLEYFAALDDWTENQKTLFADIFGYFPDASTEFVTSVVSGIQDQYAKNIVKLFQFVGGYEKTVYGVSIPYAADIQSKAVKDVISHLKDMDWFKSIPSGRLPYSTNEFIGDVYCTNIFNNLVSKYPQVQRCSMMSSSDGYSTDAFLRDISSEIFGSGKTAKTKLMPIEMVWQTAFLSYVSNKIGDDVSCHEAFLTLRSRIYNATLYAKGETAEHYAYLLHVIDKKLNE